MRNQQLPAAYKPEPSTVGEAYFQNASAPRINTDIVLLKTLRRQYPQLHIVPVIALVTPLLNYASTGLAEAKPLPDDDPALAAPLSHRAWLSPLRRQDSAHGMLADRVVYGKFEYKWKNHEFLLYLADGRDGSASYPQATYIYIISSDANSINQLIAECSSWSVALHNEIWVFDGGFWQKDRSLWQAIQGSEWKDIILDEDKKKAIRHDIENFYESRDTYKKLHVPWKRGLIFYGPPGTGKTLSIKATMHELSRRDDPIPTLYVRSIRSFSGPEYSVGQIFAMARRQAPCFLVFEDIDSIVTEDVRSYFLNEVDGLSSNDGILMVGSTNHLDRLDPGLSKRPSRFDRKYAFLDPTFQERVMYAQYWQNKLAETSEVEFPDEICPELANITKGFSFAYLQEAFVASLLTLARKASSSSSNDGFKRSIDEDAIVEHAADSQRGTMKWLLLEEYSTKMTLKGTTTVRTITEKHGDGPDLEKVPLWRELQKQVAILREGMDSGDDASKAALPFAAGGMSLSTRDRQSDAVPLQSSQIPMATDPYGRVANTTRTPEGMLQQIQRHAEHNGGTIYLDH